jgi:hypothetical protein
VLFCNKKKLGPTPNCPHDFTQNTLKTKKSIESIVPFCGIEERRGPIVGHRGRDIEARCRRWESRASEQVVDEEDMVAGEEVYLSSESRWSLERRWLSPLGGR